MQKLVWVVLAVGAMLTGCGVAAEPEVDDPFVSREDELPSCRLNPCSPGWVCVGTTCVRPCSWPDSTPCLPYGQTCCLGYGDTPPHCGNACAD
jgi:hypothetical protein